VARSNAFKFDVVVSLGWVKSLEPRSFLSKLCLFTLRVVEQSDCGVLETGQSQMKTVAEYQLFAAWCREMATRITDTEDKRAVELMAEAWEKIAGDRESVLKRGQEPSSTARVNNRNIKPPRG
jgi:hypothetical protein